MNAEQIQDVTVLSYSRRHIATVALVLLCPQWSAAGSEYCGGAPAASFELPPNQPRSGRYENPMYGYLLQIPTPLIGYAGAVAPERGFGLVLSWTPRACLRVDAAYDMYFDISAEHLHRSDLIGMRLHDRVIDDRIEPYSLGKREGGRYRTLLQCGSDPATYIHENVIVFVNREIYRLDLQTVPERYDADVKVLDAMLMSWRWLKLQPATSASGGAPPLR